MWLQVPEQWYVIHACFRVLNFDTSMALTELPQGYRVLKNIMSFETKFQYPSSYTHQCQWSNKHAEGLLCRDVTVLVISCLDWILFRCYLFSVTTISAEKSAQSVKRLSSTCCQKATDKLSLCKGKINRAHAAALLHKTLEGPISRARRGSPVRASSVLWSFYPKVAYRNHQRFPSVSMWPSPRSSQWPLKSILHFFPLTSRPVLPA